MRRPTSLALAVSLVLVLASTAVAAPPDEGAAPSGTSAVPYEYYLLTVVVRDGVTGEEVPARCSIVGDDEEPAYPVPPQSGFYHAPSYSTPGYFYTRGRSTVFLPEGPASVFITRGFEYETVTDTVGILCDTTVTFHVDRWIDTSEFGLYSGDCHTHAHHSGGIYTVEPADALFMAQAEGLNVINCLDNSYCFTGGPDACSTEDCIVYMCEEPRSCIYGHSGLLGIGNLVLPTMTTWWPLLMDVADEVHPQEGAAIISAHPISTPDFFDLDTFDGGMLARELPLDVTRYKIDGYELLSGTCDSHERTIAMWYRILNCGFRLPACSGTDACLNAGLSRPPGCYRTYVQVPGEFTYDSWLSNLVAGRTFVTNGPLFTRFEVRDFAMGDSISLGAGVTHLDGSVRVECETPLTRVDIICNGQAVQTFFAEEGECVIDVDFLLPIDESCWVAARASGPKVHASTVGYSLYAHSGPVYFTMEGERIVVESSAQELIDWLNDFQRLAVTEGEWTGPGQDIRLFQEIAAARSLYQALASGATTGVEEDQEGSVGSTALLSPGRPNPFRSEARLGFSIPREGRVRVSVFAPSGRLVRTLVDGRLPAGRHSAVWDGTTSDGLLCSSGIYMCRLDSGAETVSTKLVLLR